MSERKLIDFDAYWGDRYDEPIATMPLKYRGEVYQVPVSPPASAVLESARLDQEGSEGVDSGTLYRLAQAVLGDAYGAVSEKVQSLDELQSLLSYVGQRQADAISSPNREARRETKRRNRSTSSSPGHSSRRTSSASTASTSAQV